MLESHSPKLWQHLPTVMSTDSQGRRDIINALGKQQSGLFTNGLVKLSCVCRNPSRGWEQEGYFHTAKAAQSSSLRPEEEVLETG